MEILLRGYEVNEPTWFYLSCLLILAVFFRFGRLVSVRNVDLLLLLSITPGLLLVGSQPAIGYVWLFISSALLLVRSLSDNLLARRPQLRPNLNVAGLTFLCVAASVFLMTRVITEKPHPTTVDSVQKAERLLGSRKPVPAPNVNHAPEGPASPLISAGVVQISRATTGRGDVEDVAARILVVLSHISVVVGLILVGRNLFADHETGIAMATLYMLLPCTAHDIGKATHVLPAALVIWAIFAYRRPILSGMLLGLACGILFFPILLLPLWCVFYGWRGTLRFGAAVVLIAGVMLTSQFLMSPDAHASLRQVLGYLEWEELHFGVSNSASLGFWHWHNAAWRIPVFVTYLVMLVALCLWPRKKHLGHLIAHSAATVIGIQFWYLQQGGIYVLWYLPLLLLMVFRPTLIQHSAPEIAPARSTSRTALTDQTTALAGFTRLQWR